MLRKVEHETERDPELCPLTGCTEEGAGLVGVGTLSLSGASVLEGQGHVCPLTSWCASGQLWGCGLLFICGHQSGLCGSQGGVKRTMECRRQN